MNRSCSHVDNCSHNGSNSCSAVSTSLGSAASASMRAIWLSSSGRRLLRCCARSCNSARRSVADDVRASRPCYNTHLLRDSLQLRFDVRLLPLDPRSISLAAFFDLSQYRTQHSRVAADAAKLIQHSVLEGGRRDRSRLTLRPSSLVSLHAHVVAVQLGLLVDVGVDHSDVATGATHQAFQQCAVLVADVAAATVAIAAQGTLDPVPDVVVGNALVFSLVDLAAVFDFAGVDHVRQHVVEAVLGNRFSARLPAFACRPGLHAPSAAVQFFYHRDQRARTQGRAQRSRAPAAPLPHSPTESRLAARRHNRAPDCRRPIFLCAARRSSCRACVPRSSRARTARRTAGCAASSGPASWWC